jgi:hypothetical protein
MKTQDKTPAKTPRSCPDCFQLPEFKIENHKAVLVCDQHGHVAMGDSLETATENWNRYIEFVDQEAR